jgi:hypothetical protein
MRSVSGTRPPLGRRVSRLSVAATVWPTLSWVFRKVPGPEDLALVSEALRIDPSQMHIGDCRRLSCKRAAPAGSGHLRACAEASLARVLPVAPSDNAGGARIHGRVVDLVGRWV